MPTLLNNHIIMVEICKLLRNDVNKYFQVNFILLINFDHLRSSNYSLITHDYFLHRIDNEPLGVFSSIRRRVTGDITDPSKGIGSDL
jgi:hypothetical protein